MQRDQILGKFFQNISKYYQKSEVPRGPYLKNLNVRKLILTNLLHFDLTSSQILILSLFVEYLEVGNLYFSVPWVPGILPFWMCKQENPEDNTRSKLNAKEELLAKWMCHGLVEKIT